MRILWLKSDLLLPLDKGGKLRTWHLMRHLARRHEITYLSFAEAAPAEMLAGMREVAAHLVTIHRSDPRKRSLRFYLDAAWHLADSLPYAIGKYRSRAFRSALQDLLHEGGFDLVVCDFLTPAVNLPARLPCPAVLFTHNVEAEIWRRHKDTASGVVGRALYALQHRRMVRYEGRTLGRFDHVLAVSDADRDTLGRLYPGAVRAPIHVVPTGVDTEYFQPLPTGDGGPRLTFTGSMDWLPNEDAMLYFCREVLPLVRAKEPGIQLSIVGRAPTRAVQRLAADPAVLVTGTVADVRPFVHAASVYVVPLRIGGGTRLKIFEAMAMGKAVVSTTVGAEGLPVVDGEHVALADGPAPFAAAILRLLRDADHRRRIEKAARALVVERYDWGVAAAVLEDALVQATARPSRDALMTSSLNPAPPPGDGAMRAI
jgi:sugar transferase (PEP-CTERM/EpsH1 system associated)